MWNKKYEGTLAERKKKALEVFFAKMTKEEKALYLRDVEQRRKRKQKKEQREEHVPDLVEIFGSTN